MCVGIRGRGYYPIRNTIYRDVKRQLGSFDRRRCRWIANSRLLQHRSHSVEQEVEWMYALDIHSNSFFPLFVWLYVVQVRQRCSLTSFYVLVLLWVGYGDKFSPTVPKALRHSTGTRKSGTHGLEHPSNRESCVFFTAGSIVDSATSLLQK